MKKTCWIIGASHGIGEALAKKFYNENYNIVISARSLEKLELVKENLLKNQGKNSIDFGEVLAIENDVTNLTSVQVCVQQVLAKFTKIDLIIFCPALYQPMPAAGFDIAVAKNIVDVNFVGFLNILHFILPEMIKQKQGKIAVIASVAGYVGLPNSFTYGASKAALINLCEGIYPELKSHGINIYTINPGFVKTRLTAKNNFSMPFLISSETAANLIFKGVEGNDFEIHFPKKFTFFIKFLKILPYKIFFFITKKLL